MLRVTNNVYAETGYRGCNVGFVVTSEGVVMIESPMVPEDSIKWRDEMVKYGPVRYLINTEPHGDHFSGNCFFGGTVIGHEGTREAILASSLEQFKNMLKQMAPGAAPLDEHFYFRPPTITLSQRLTLHLGNHTVKLINMPGHTPYQVAVYLPEERVVFTSDNVVHGHIPFMHQALPFAWLDALKQLEQLDAEVFIPGHGSVCSRSYIAEMSANIQTWIDEVTKAINEGLSLEQAQDRILQLERFKLGVGEERMVGVQRNNIAHLYEALSSTKKTI
jgi:glyoxylase-like metal-dependent hydrolase (beta-lactamase superfamily II)